MNRIVIILLAAFLLTPARAVENGSSYQTMEPTSTQVPNWTTGWGAGGITGWDYVGQVNAASGIYLGNGWVLTAGHVGTGNFVLGGNTYALIVGSSQSISNGYGTADLCLFQIDTTSLNNSAVLTLPPLVLATLDPIPFAYGTPGTSVVIIGYGGGQGESWGFNTITQTNIPIPITVNGNNFDSNDFLTLTGVTTYDNPQGPGSQSITNNAQLVFGDSGGGVFNYNAVTNQWNLAGLNEVTGTDDSGQDLSGFVQLDTYASQIEAIAGPPPNDSPTMPLPGLWIMACLLFLAARKALPKSALPFRAGHR
jgi:hypothetical protein